MSKGEDTKRTILGKGLSMASTLGLDLVSIGSLAKATNMSKSGLFAHFQSKENLQVEILRHAGDVFAERIVVPALKTQAGIPRIMALVANWIQWTSRLKGGCIFVSASSDFTDRPGKVRDFLLNQQKEWLECLRRIAKSAVTAGDFREDIDCDQFAFDLYSLLLGFHLYHNLLESEETKRRQEKALEQLLNTYRPTSSNS
ncbi:Transcriptional regulator, AcrR family [Olavius algarvensis associated proteobacterium Delta 3]|nr:Transcriptional regulator, AcrR family [Olavius algarvensis associated proteobacterium Delta 3]CAB5099243.1 Transcriptional regulator, AcrR family [Olavius algarvensis associated proteobacterium Delta 3]